MITYKKEFPLEKQASQDLSTTAMSVVTSFAKDWQLDEVRIHLSEQISETVTISSDDIKTPIDDVSYLGAWDAAITYVIGDIVINEGVYYECIAESTNNEPPNVNYWGVWTYDTVLKTEALTNQTDFVWQPSQKVLLKAGDEIKVAVTNGNLTGIAYLTVEGHEV